MEDKLEDASNLFDEGREREAIELLEQVISDFPSDDLAVNSVLQQLLNNGHLELAEELIARHSIEDELIEPDLHAQMKRIHESRQEPSDSGKGEVTFRRMNLRERGNPTSVHFWSRAFARSITLSESGVEIKRAFSTKQFTWGQVSEVTLESVEVMGGNGLSPFKYLRKYLAFHLADSIERVDVSTTRPDFSDPKGIIERVKTHKQVRQVPSVSNVRRQRRTSVVVFALFYVVLALIWLLEH